MPEFSFIQVGLTVLILALGFVAGWFVRADRCSKEKIAVNASWQEQVDGQQAEQDRLTAQNRSLMEHVAQYQASNRDTKLRAKELSDALKETLGQRDELQRSLKEVRTQVDDANAERDTLITQIESTQISSAATVNALKEKDDKIFTLSRELTTWQSRVPPLVERFKQRHQEAEELREMLDEAQGKIDELEEQLQANQTRVDELDAESIPDSLDASNEGYTSTFTGEHEFAVSTEDAEPGEESADDPEVEDPSILELQITLEADDEDDDEYDEDYADEAVLVAEEASAEEDSGKHERDDLKQIKGVGPAIERTLNELGICRFNQIAEMSEHEIDRVAKQLRGFRSRIYREDWIGQARTLQYQKENEYV